MNKIYFKNSNGQKICGVLSDPVSNTTKSDTVVLICHGLGGNKNDMSYNLLQDTINNLGLATFKIDFLGHGESDGNYDDLTLTEAIDDILRASEELHSRGYKDIGFIGYSFGGVGGIMATSKEKFKFMILISPPTYYDISEMVKSSIYILWELRKHNKKLTDKKKASIKIAFFRDYGSHDSYAAAEKINAPTLIIHGDQDKIVPLAKSRELRKKIKGSKIKIFKGVGHHYSDPLAKKILIEKTIKFVKENM